MKSQAIRGIAAILKAGSEKEMELLIQALTTMALRSLLMSLDLLSSASTIGQLLGNIIPGTLPDYKPSDRRKSLDKWMVCSSLCPEQRRAAASKSSIWLRTVLLGTNRSPDRTKRHQGDFGALETRLHHRRYF